MTENPLLNGKVNGKNILRFEVFWCFIHIMQKYCASKLSLFMVNPDTPLFGFLVETFLKNYKKNYLWIHRMIWWGQKLCKQTTTEICLEVKMLHTHELMFTRALEDSVKKMQLQNYGIITLAVTLHYRLYNQV